MFNFLAPVWDVERAAGVYATTAGTDPDATVLVSRVNVHIGSDLLGSSLYRLEPGGVQSPIHWHIANEEMVVVLRGTATMRTPEGTVELPEGTIVGCRKGPQGAHRIENLGDEPLLFLMVTTLNYPDVVEHNDTGETLLFEEAPFREGKTVAPRSVGSRGNWSR